MDDLVAMNEVLMAMADSVMEKQPKPFNPSLKFHDKKIDFKIGGKPPREIFYRKTVTFMTRLPPAVQRKLCNCQYICSGDVATIKCHSCAIYDPSGSSFYCTACYQSRHPWYRVKHINTPIKEDESIEHTLKIAHRMAEAARYEKEGVDLLSGLRAQIPALQFIADDEKVDDKLRVYGRRVVALEDHVMRLREYIHDDIEESKTRMSLVAPLSQLTNAPFNPTEQPLLITTSPEAVPETTNSRSSPKVQFSPKNNKNTTRNSKEIPGLSHPSPHSNHTSSTTTTSTALVPATSTVVAFPVDPQAIMGMIKLQATYRRWIGKRIVSSIVSARTIRVWSPELGRGKLLLYIYL